MELGVYLTLALALGFAYTNGFHDAANSIATVVSTRVLSPRYAVIWAAFFNFVAFLVFGTAVASTIANDVVVQDVPTSSSHALVGGIAGAAVARDGTGVLIESGLRKFGVFIVLSPLIGLALG